MREIVEQITKELEVSKNEAELILASLLEKPRFELYMMEDIDKDVKHLVTTRLGLLKNGMPLEYVTKRTQFMDYSLCIYPGVFIPRFETEYFIELIGQLTDIIPEKILDIGTGTGAISIALAHLYPKAQIYATDISDIAIECAQENIKAYGLTSRIILAKCDICQDANTMFDMIVSNPPYIPSSRLCSLPKSVRDFEPMLAIDGGNDGTRFIRAIMERASGFLKPGGIMAFEIDEDTTGILKDYMSRQGYGPISFEKDQYGKYRYLFIGDIKK